MVRRWGLALLVIVRLQLQREQGVRVRALLLDRILRGWCRHGRCLWWEGCGCHRGRDLRLDPGLLDGEDGLGEALFLVHLLLLLVLEVVQQLWGRRRRPLLGVRERSSGGG